MDMKVQRILFDFFFVKFSIFDCQFSIVNYKLSNINHKLSNINHKLSIMYREIQIVQVILSIFFKNSFIEFSTSTKTYWMSILNFY
jgi:hypothetical protein